MARQIAICREHRSGPASEKQRREERYRRISASAPRLEQTTGSPVTRDFECRLPSCSGTVGLHEDHVAEPCAGESRSALRARVRTAV